MARDSSLYDLLREPVFHLLLPRLYGTSAILTPTSYIRPLQSTPNQALALALLASPAPALARVDGRRLSILARSMRSLAALQEPSRRT